MTTVEGYLKDLWEKTLDYLTEIKDPGLDELIINTYYRSARLVSLDNNKAIIVVASEINKQIMDRTDLIELALNYILQEPVKCSVITETELKENKVKQENIFDNNSSQNDNEFQLKLNPEFTFENFVEGTSNREARTASIACAYSPGKFYTPLFIYGNSGLGKTHLLQAIGNYVKKHDPTKKIYYTSGSDFVESVVSSIQKQSIDQFKRKLYEIDILLMDDVQFIAGKEKSHEIFFSIFNELVNNRKQICITSDKHPTEIKGLEERLISRFSSGLSVGVDSPEFETAVAILRLKINNQVGNSFQIDDDVISYLATNFSKDVRSLEGCINRLMFLSINSASGDHITLEDACQCFKGQVSVINKGDTLDAYGIKNAVADYYGLTKQQLTSKSRTSNISSARHIAMYLCRKLLDLPYGKIGDEFGKRDHSTVISACDKVEKKLKKDILYQQALMELESRLKAH